MRLTLPPVNNLYWSYVVHNLNYSYGDLTHIGPSRLASLVRVCVCWGGGGEGEHFNYFENPNVRNSAKAWMQEFFQGVEGFEVSKKGLKHSISDGLSCARLVLAQSVSGPLSPSSGGEHDQ